MQTSHVNYLAQEFKKTHEHKYFERLYEELYPGIKTYVSQFFKTGDPEIILDVVADTFSKVYMHIDSFKTEFSITTWVYRIARNSALGQLKKRKKENHVRVDFSIPTLHTNMEENEEDDSMDNTLFYHSTDFEFPNRSGKEILEELVRTELKNLPEIYSQVLLEYEINGLDYAAIAQEFDLKIGTVKTRIHRARAILEKRVKERTSVLVERGLILEEDIKNSY